MFPRLNPDYYQVTNDARLILELLDEEKILLVQGSAFNIKDNNHFRLVFLPREDILEKAAESLARFLARRRQRLANVG
jgi:alanine-synthesizing transaminase